MKKYSHLVWSMKNDKTQKHIIGSRKNGEWICVSSELKNFIDEFVGMGDRQHDYLQDIEKEELPYLTKLLNIMEAHGFVEDSEAKGERKFVFTFEVTKKCNLSCKHCSMNSLSIHDRTKELSTDQLKTCISVLTKLGASNIVLTGGEPMTRDDFFEIIQYIRQTTEIAVGLMTNATLINSSNVFLLKEGIDTIDISIDGVDERTCSLIRGKKTFDKVVSAINLLNEIGFENKSLSMVETNETAMYKADFYKLADSLKCKPFIRKLEYVGRAKKNRAELDRLPFKARSAQTNELQSYSTYAAKDIRGLCCGAFDREFFVASNGDVYPCALFESFSEYKIGNVFDEDIKQKFANIYNSSQYAMFWDYINRMPLKCHDCSVRFFCHTCPYISVTSARNKEFFDSMCQGRKDFFYETVWGI